MHYRVHNFRHAVEIASHMAAWSELQEVLASVQADEVIAAHETIVAARENPPAGAQAALNALFRVLLRGWISEARLYERSDENHRGWRMDFLKDKLGVEVSFNHAEAIPWTLTRLNLAGESKDVILEHRIDVGVAIYATESLKRWGRMDGSVGTFERARAWLELMRPIMPVPILMVGLEADGWEPASIFRGTRQR